MDSVHHIWCPLSSQEFQDLPDGAETTLTLKKLRPQSVTSRIQPGSDVIVCAEMDEQWGYVGAKSRQRWLFYAYDRIRRTVVAHVFGERTLATLECCRPLRSWYG